MRIAPKISAAAALLASACAHGQQLQPGTNAPAFELAGTDGEIHSLGEHLGKRAVIIAWFPKAFTGG